MAKKQYSTSLDEALLKKLKLLAVKVDKKANELIEEALELLFKKHEEDLKK